jgi:hypothetical protein
VLGAAVNVREVIQFESDLPDGAVEAEDGTDFIVWPARPAKEALREVLIGLGCEADEIYSVEFKGWEFNFRYQGRNLWCRATQIDRYVAYFKDCGFWPNVVGGRGRRYVELLGRLNEALSRDERFRSVQWYMLQAFDPDAQGVPNPVG